MTDGARSTGVLLDALNSTGTLSHIDVITDRATRYDGQSWDRRIPPYASVMSCQINATTVTTITGGVRLSGLTWGRFDQYETVREEHNAGDAVQKCAYFKAMRPIDVFRCCLRTEPGLRQPISHILTG